MLNLEKLGVDYPPVTFLTRYANKNLKWIPTDTEELYKKNCKDLKLKEYIQQWDDKITYKLNSHGYRCPDPVENTESIVALGCSHTFGVGLPEEDIYCSVLAKMLNCPLYNFGVPGGASDTAFRIASYWLPIIKPKYVVMVGPQYTRFELRAYSDDPHVFVPGTLNTNIGEADERIIQQMIKRYVVNAENPIFNRQKNLLAIESLTMRFGGRFYSYSENIPNTGGNARDNMHFGPEWHKDLAETIYKEIT